MGVLKNKGALLNFCANERNNDALYFTTSSHFHTRKSFLLYACFGRTSVTHYEHLFCVAPGNKHKETMHEQHALTKIAILRIENQILAFTG